MKKLDRLNFTTLYYLLGRLGNHVDTEGLKTLNEILTELDKVLGYDKKEPTINSD